MGYDHLVFDLDGTLVDSSRDLAEAVNHTLRTRGRRQLSLDTIRGYVGEGGRVLIERALGEAENAEIEAALALFLDYYGAHLLDHTTAYTGIPEALRQLAARRVTLSVLTNKPEALSRAVLEGAGIGGCFAAVIGGDTLARRKPDAAGLEHLRAGAGASRERTVMIGDSAIDLRTARAGGVAFRGVAWGFKPGELRAAGVTPLLERPSELLALVDADTSESSRGRRGSRSAR